MTRLYPLFINLDQHPVLVVGAGTTATHKVQSLCSYHAIVTVVAPCVSESLRSMAEKGEIQLHIRPFVPDDVLGMRLVIAATHCASVNNTIVERCRQLGIWVNTVDDPSRCDFHTPAVVHRDPVQVAVSTGGLAPALSKTLKEEISNTLELTLGAYANLVSEARARVFRVLSGRNEQERKQAINKTMEAVLSTNARKLLASGDPEGALRAIDKALDSMLSNYENEP